MSRSKNREAVSNLTDQIFEFIRDYCRTNDIPPSYREIQDGVGIRSLSTVKRHVDKLLQAGALAGSPNKARSFRPVAARQTGTVSGDTVRERMCLEVRDGGKLYFDCVYSRSDELPGGISFEGIVDAGEMKGRVGQVVRSHVSRE